MNNYRESDGEIIPDLSGVNQPHFPRGSQRDTEQPDFFHQNIPVLDSEEEALAEVIDLTADPTADHDARQQARMRGTHPVFHQPEVDELVGEPDDEATAEWKQKRAQARALGATPVKLTIAQKNANERRAMAIHRRTVPKQIRRR